MIDINFIRENPEIVKKAVRDKRMDTDIDRLLVLDKIQRAALAEMEALRFEKNKLTQSIAQNDENKEINRARVKEVKGTLAEKIEEYTRLRGEYETLLLTVPSVPAPEVPVGTDENDNVEIRRWGEAPRFDFEPKDHMALAESLNLVDVPRAVKFAGSRSYFLKNEGLLLEMAVTRFAIDRLVSKGFTPLSVPMMVQESAMRGTGYFPIGYDQAYKLPEDGLFLVGTSEVSLVSQHQNEVLGLKELPLRYAGYSSCFRREAGTYGKDTRGLYRVHQFQKVEQVVFCKADDTEAERLHYELLGNAEELLQALELPYRVALACTGEIGIGQIRKHEVETFMPSRGSYCETHSCSTMGDFQARRLNIRYRDESGELKFVYTLNNTAIASPRILIPLLENHQQADGSVKIPKALVPYMNGMTFIYPKNMK